MTSKDSDEWTNWIRSLPYILRPFRAKEKSFIYNKESRKAGLPDSWIEHLKNA